LPTGTAKRIELLDHPKLIAQLCGLERRTARSGKDSFDHAPGAHDDVANAVAGVVAMAHGHQGVVVTPDLLARVMAMPARRQTFGRRRNNVFIPPPEQRRQGFLPAEKLEKESPP
jgi:hypothetical protein